MDWKIFFATFGAVFLAELADKTQLVVSVWPPNPGNRYRLAGSVSAYIIVTVISVFIGAALSRYLSPGMIRYAGASLFIIIGVLMLLKIV